MSRVARKQPVKVLVVGQTPPPHGGQALMIERLVNNRLDGVQLIHVRMAFSSHMNEIGRVRLGKILHLFGLIARIIYHRFADGVRILYYPPAGPDRVPMIRDLVILNATRWLFDKTIFHFHAGGGSEVYGRLPAWQRWLFRRAYFGVDAAIRLTENSPDDGRRLQARWDVIVPNGIEDPCPDWVPTPATDLIESGKPLQILFVGILRESKGVQVLVEACAHLAERGVPFRLELMGQWHSEEFAADVRRQIDAAGLGDRVQFLGVLTGEEKLRAFRRADVLCFPTHFESETFGLVLVEAMSFGIPVVSTRWRGIPSIVDEGDTGYLVEPRDAAAVADRLARLYASGELRRQMGAAGRQRFVEEFSLPSHLERMREVFLEVAGVPTTKEQHAVEVLTTS